MQRIKIPFFIVDEHPTTFSETLDPRGMHGFKISNYPFSRVDERIQENKITFKGLWYVAFLLNPS